MERCLQPHLSVLSSRRPFARECAAHLRASAFRKAQEDSKGSQAQQPLAFGPRAPPLVLLSLVRFKRLFVCTPFFPWMTFLQIWQFPKVPLSVSGCTSKLVPSRSAQRCVRMAKVLKPPFVGSLPRQTPYVVQEPGAVVNSFPKQVMSPAWRTSPCGPMLCHAWLSPDSPRVLWLRSPTPYFMQEPTSATAVPAAFQDPGVPVPLPAIAGERGYLSVRAGEGSRATASSSLLRRSGSNQWRCRDSGQFRALPLDAVFHVARVFCQTTVCSVDS